MERLKVAFIGAGSAIWSSTIVIDLLINEGLRERGLDIWLMDISDSRLDIIYGFAKRYVEEMKANARVYRTKDRREAIKDADFVINSAMAGGHGYYERMREVSEQYGYYRGINSVEWNMVSDYHTIWGYYQLKLVLDVSRDIEELAPDAWFINVANPVFELSTLIPRKTKVKYIGLCHGHLGFLKAVEVLGIRLAEEKLDEKVNALCAAKDPRGYAAVAKVVDPRELKVEMTGFNHVIWLSKFRYMGEDAYRYFDEWVEKNAEEYWRIWSEHVTSPFDIDLSPAAVNMYKVYGLYPVGDTVRGGTWKYHWDLKTKQRWYGPLGGPDSEIGWAMYLAHLRIRLEELSRAVMDQSTPLVKRYPPRPSGESLVEIVEAIANDNPKESYTLRPPAEGAPPIPVPIQVNVPNKGALPGVPDDVAVEMPVRVDGKGVHRKVLTPLPRKVMSCVILPRMMRMEWALTAFLEGGRDLLVEWLMIDPRTKSTSQAEEAVDAILKLPENDEMAKHFR